MKTFERILPISLVIAAVLLLGGCLPGPAGPAAPLPPGLAISCLTPLAILVVIALIVALVVYLVRGREATGPGTITPVKRTPEPSAREIARRRYASGEITYDELQEILRILDQTEGRRTT